MCVFLVPAVELQLLWRLGAVWFVFMLGEMDRSNLTPVWRKIQCMLYFKGMNPYCFHQPAESHAFGQLRVVCSLCDLSTFTVYIRSRGCDKIAPCSAFLFVLQHRELRRSRAQARSVRVPVEFSSVSSIIIILFLLNHPFDKEHQPIGSNVIHQWR